MIEKKLSPAESDFLAAFLARYEHYARQVLWMYLAANLFSWVAVGWYGQWWAAVVPTIFVLSGYLWVWPIWRLVIALRADVAGGTCLEWAAKAERLTRRRTLFGEEELFLWTAEGRWLLASESLLAQANTPDLLLRRTPRAGLVFAS